MVCELQAALKAAGLRLHSIDLAPWGSWGVFNVSTLAACVDYALPMACECNSIHGATALDSRAIWI